ncbi:hypothetical protein [Arthrobacter glacialis]|uniref:Uncharacterized protein n=1 Tax=Arthrobacter glacialis TaxID=1664 RepID=A0A2S3ZR68_ARTGL|nr:hypothetical protein [Arthrobacter glacialis]POH71599.1 hypothetical protein CVS27_20140 [Arthrobacter glacialis]
MSTTKFSSGWIDEDLRDGDDHPVTGSKIYISNGQSCDLADRCQHLASANEVVKELIARSL